MLQEKIELFFAFIPKSAYEQANLPIPPAMHYVEPTFVLPRGSSGKYFSDFALFDGCCIEVIKE